VCSGQALTILRFVNLGLAATFRPDTVLVALLLVPSPTPLIRALTLSSIVWSMTTLVLNRSLLRLRRAKIRDDDNDFACGANELANPAARSLPPFSVRPRFEADDVLERGPGCEMYSLRIARDGKTSSPSDAKFRESHTNRSPS
jgi:hypothetical protein